MNGYEALRTGAAWFDLSSRGKIRALGEDRVRLMHAMSTNDVKNLPEGHNLYAFFLNDKGRILADAWIYHFADSLLLDTEPECARLLFEHLDKYIIADDVTLEDETNVLAEVAIEGPGAVDAATKCGLPVPTDLTSVELLANGFVSRVSATGASAVRVFVPAIEKAALIEKLKVAGVVQATVDEVRVVRLEHGTPRYGEDISDRYLAQETQLAQAIHFNKGCYLGQEIVERVRSRGQVHRLLAPLRIAAKSAPAAGTKILSGAEAVAEITSAVFSEALGEVVAMGYVRREALENKPPMVVADTEPPIAARIA